MLPGGASGKARDKTVKTETYKHPGRAIAISFVVIQDRKTKAVKRFRNVAKHPWWFLPERMRLCWHSV